MMENLRKDARQEHWQQTHEVVRQVVSNLATRMLDHDPLAIWSTVEVLYYVQEETGLDRAVISMHIDTISRDREPILEGICLASKPFHGEPVIFFTSNTDMQSLDVLEQNTQ